MTIPTLGRLSGGRSGGVQDAIQLASTRTGIDFNYLLGQAQVESGLNASARAGTSSATGLYQFIEQSWLGVVKAHGAEHGLGWAASSIGQTAGGRFTVGDPATRRAILALRNDPATASLMAAEHASDNKDALEASLGRDATGTDLYMAHFLGLGGARQFLSAMAANPGRSAAAMFPAAAGANRNVFFGPGGTPRSLEQVYARFSAKLGDGAGAVEAAPSPMRALMLEGDGEVIPGTDAGDGDDTWLQTTLANLNVLSGRRVETIGTGRSVQTASINPLRPTPDTARLAYLMLARMGG